MNISASSLLVKLLLIGVLLTLIYVAKPFLMPLAIGLVIATLFLPMSNRLERMHVPRALSAGMCLLLIVLLFLGIFFIAGMQIYRLAADVDVLKDRIILAWQMVQDFIFKNAGLSLESQNQLISQQQPLFTNWIKNIAAALPSIAADGGLILMYVLFLLYYRSHLKQFVLKLFPGKEQDEVQKVVHSVAHVSQQYIFGLSKMIVCLWVLYGIGFSLLGLENALFFAFLCGLLEIIPYIGNLTGTLITVLMAAVQGAAWPVLLGILLVYGAIQFFQGWVLEPLIVGAHVKLNPLFTIIALVIGGLLWGIAGVFLAIPVMAMLKIVCDHIEPLKPYGFLMSEVEKGRK